MVVPVYEKRPDGLLRGRSELIVLALRCNEFAVLIAFESSWDNDDVLLFNRKPWRGDDGQDDVCRFCVIDNRERDAFDFFRKIPCLVSALQTPCVLLENHFESLVIKIHTNQLKIETALKCCNLYATWVAQHYFMYTCSSYMQVISVISIDDQVDL